MIHGTTHAYNKGCRCEPCRVSKSNANKLARQRHPVERKANPAKRGRKPRKPSAWEFKVELPKRKKSQNAWSFKVVKSKRKLYTAWDYTAVIPKKIQRKMDQERRAKNPVMLSQFETKIDILRYAKYASSPFTIRNLMDDVTDWNWSKVKVLVFDLVDDGYLTDLTIGKIFKFEKTDKTVQLIGE